MRRTNARARSWPARARPPRAAGSPGPAAGRRRPPQPRLLEVDGLDREHQRPSLDGGAPSHGVDARVGHRQPWPDRQRQLDHVPGDERPTHRDRTHRRRSCALRCAQRRAGRPGRHAQRQRPRLVGGSHRGHPDDAVVRVPGLHVDGDRPTVRQHGADARRARTGGSAGRRRRSSRRRTPGWRACGRRWAGSRRLRTTAHASTTTPAGRRRPSAGTVPGATLVQRVRVVERRAVVRRRRRHHVVEGALDQVGVARLPLGEQQAPGEHDRADAGARLGVRAVRRQHEVVAERLVHVVRPLPARDVRAASDGVLPLGGQRGEQLCVAGLDGDVDRAGGQVVGAHGVPAQDRRLPDRDVVLVVGAAVLDVAERPRAAARDEERGLVDVAGLPRRPAQLGQRGLDLGVPADRDPIRRARTWPRRGPRRDGRRRRGRRPRRTGPQPGDRRLEEVPVAVQLVPPLEVAVRGRPARGARTPCSR